VAWLWRPSALRLGDTELPIRARARCISGQRRPDEWIPMNYDSGSTLWAVALIVAAVGTNLRTLIALDKWNGARFMFVKGSRAGNIFVAAFSFLGVICFLVGLLLSLSQ
jgi:hypothetical protein